MAGAPILPVAFHVAPQALPPYRERFMGQQLRRTVKRRRRAAYLERKKVKAKEAAAGRSEGKAKGKKQPATAAAAG
jgi:hypothetical protein